MPLLTEMAKDGLLSMEGREITVSRTGRQYIRMICQAFDMKWWMQKGIPDKKMFSSSI
jgi:coproporphyrinogen III oxidase-like Fe-S oxidoreductase